MSRIVGGLRLVAGPRSARRIPTAAARVVKNLDGRLLLWLGLGAGFLVALQGPEALVELGHPLLALRLPLPGLACPGLSLLLLRGIPFVLRKLLLCGQKDLQPQVPLRLGVRHEQDVLDGVPLASRLGFLVRGDLDGGSLARVLGRLGNLQARGEADHPPRLALGQDLVVQEPEQVPVLQDEPPLPPGLDVLALRLHPTVVVWLLPVLNTLGNGRGVLRVVALAGLDLAGNPADDTLLVPAGAACSRLPLLIVVLIPKALHLPLVLLLFHHLAQLHACRSDGVQNVAHVLTRAAELHLALLPVPTRPEQEGVLVADRPAGDRVEREGLQAAPVVRVHELQAVHAYLAKHVLRLAELALEGHLVPRGPARRAPRWRRRSPRDRNRVARVGVSSAMPRGGGGVVLLIAVRYVHQLLGLLLGLLR
mmetsp:Transcript_1252/g.3821  ORF Transcript_1252/g.3821 Transcript_1252/m.3821 type:complete len:422 (+) Transcript_1252:315-1580(+)